MCLKKVWRKVLENMGHYLSELLLNRGPEDVESKNRTILKHVHPNFYDEIRQQLVQDKEDLLKGKLSLMFRVEVSEIYRISIADYTFVLEGELIVFDRGETLQVDRRRYLFGFQCQNHRMLLVSLKREGVV